MKTFIFILALSSIVACTQQTQNSSKLQQQVDSLKNQLAASYKPGFGEFMGSIQTHHSKLWFSGIHENWKLADFEIHEMKEAIENIKKYQQKRKESALIDMMAPSLNSVMAAVKHKDLIQFKSSYTSLTNACNTCHRDTQFEFNIVKIPDSQPFSNQEFKIISNR
jgi:hypothetical protein